MQNVILIAAAVMSLSDEMCIAMPFYVVDGDGFETVSKSEIRNSFSDLAEHFNLNATKLQRPLKNICPFSQPLANAGVMRQCR